MFLKLNLYLDISWQCCQIVIRNQKDFSKTNKNETPEEMFRKMANHEGIY